MLLPLPCWLFAVHPPCEGEAYGRTQDRDDALIFMASCAVGLDLPMHLYSDIGWSHNVVKPRGNWRHPQEFLFIMMGYTAGALAGGGGVHDKEQPVWPTPQGLI